MSEQASSTPPKHAGAADAVAPATPAAQDEKNPKQKRVKPIFMYAIMFFLAFNVIGSVCHPAHGEFNLLYQVLSGFPDLIMFFYFPTSKKAAAVLVNDISLECGDIADRPSPRTWAF